MKGSDRWGERSGPRVELVLGVLVIISALGVAFYYIESSALTSNSQAGVVATVSTTGTRCNSDSIPRAALKVEQSSSFTALSKGHCFNYLGQSSSAGGGNLVFSFAYYNGTVTYPCGTSPEQVPESEIQAVVTPGGDLVSAQLVPPISSGQRGYCDSSIPVKVVSLDDVFSTIPAVPQLNLTLAANAARPITALRVVLSLDGGSQIFQFNSVSPGSPLKTPNTVSLTEIVLSGVSFASNEVYPLTISGTYDDGRSFSVLAHAQVTHAP